MKKTLLLAIAFMFIGINGYSKPSAYYLFYELPVRPPMQMYNKIFIGWIGTDEAKWKDLGYQNQKEWVDLIGEANREIQHHLQTSMKDKTFIFAKSKTDLGPPDADLFIRFSVPAYRIVETVLPLGIGSRRYNIGHIIKVSFYGKNNRLIHSAVIAPFEQIMKAFASSGAVALKPLLIAQMVNTVNFIYYRLTNEVCDSDGIPPSYTEKYLKKIRETGGGSFITGGTITSNDDNRYIYAGIRHLVWFYYAQELPQGMLRERKYRCVSGDCENGFGSRETFYGEFLQDIYTGQFKNKIEDGIGRSIIHWYSSGDIIWERSITRKEVITYPPQHYLRRTEFQDAEEKEITATSIASDGTRIELKSKQQKIKEIPWVYYPVDIQVTTTFPDGRKFTGQGAVCTCYGAFNSHYYVFHNATYTYPGGDRYAGELVNGMMHGRGTLTRADGTKYVGEFFRNVKQGIGVEYNALGKEIRKGAWNNDEYAGEK